MGTLIYFQHFPSQLFYFPSFHESESKVSHDGRQYLEIVGNVSVLSVHVHIHSNIKEKQKDEERKIRRNHNDF